MLENLTEFMELIGCSMFINSSTYIHKTEAAVHVICSFFLSQSWSVAEITLFFFCRLGLLPSLWLSVRLVLYFFIVSAMFYLSFIYPSLTLLYYHSSGNWSAGNVKERGRNAFSCKGKTAKGISTFKSEVSEFFVVVFFGDLYAVSLSCEFSFFVNSCDGTYLPEIIFFSAEIIPQRIFLFFQ